MLLLQIFASIIRLFIGSLTALVLFPLWILIALATSPLRILDAHAHATLVGHVYNFFLRIVFLDIKGRGY